MRKFTSYGPVDPDLHYYSPRKELIEKAYAQLMGEDPRKGGHYFTVWAPRQTGKTWVMQEVLFRLRKCKEFDVLKINLEVFKDKKNAPEVFASLARYIGEGVGKTLTNIDNQEKFQDVFKKNSLEKPLILILDEFDALLEEGINAVVSAFRNIYINRIDERDKPTEQKTYLLHGVALIGIRSVLGIENQKGSPFNVQRSVHIPNLTHDEVKGIFQWYQKESGQTIDPGVTDRLFYETNGQPGLTCWFGELLTETYNRESTAPITMKQFKYSYANASNVLPNNNILNLISKVKKAPYREMAIELFKTDEKIEFRFDNEDLNYLYMNGVIDYESVENETGETEAYCKFSNPFVQTRLFNYFSRKMFDYMGQLIHPLDVMEDAADDENLYIPNIIKRYQAYLTKNQGVFFKDVPRRKTDMKIYEAIYHFNLYRYLYDLLRTRGVEVIPQFPTGNGKIDLILRYREKVYALELKSFKDMYMYEKSIDQAASYGRQLGLNAIVLLVFVELSQEEARPLEREVDRGGIQVTVLPVGVIFQASPVPGGGLILS